MASSQLGTAPRERGAGKAGFPYPRGRGRLASEFSELGLLGERVRRERSMKLNIFSGARRLALLLAALVSVLALGITAFHEPKVAPRYTVTAPNAPFLRTNEWCSNDAALHFFEAPDPSGDSVHVTLCLPSVSSTGGEAEPRRYKINSKGVIWAAANNSTDLLTYQEALERRFRLTPSLLEPVAAENAEMYWQQWRTTLLYLPIGLGVFWLLVTAVGWVVRGFVGIPHGKDSEVATDGDGEH